MKKIIGLLLAIIIMGITFAGCDDMQTVDQKQEDQQEKMLKDMNNQIGLPDIKEWTEKKSMKRIIEARDDSKLICYVYTKNTMSGKYDFEGKSIGYPIPYATQYTNPERYEMNGTTLPQADPNGLFSPSSADATWVMMINEDTGKTEVQYYEDKLNVTQTKKPIRLCETWSLPSNY